MYILHGTWIPDETESFIQGGQFYLWIETDEPSQRRVTGIHLCQLRQQQLAVFLGESLGIPPLQRSSLEQEIVTRYFLLPSTAKEPLPSWEMAQYLETTIPEKLHWQTWQIDCYPVLIALGHSDRMSNLIKLLHELHFLTQYHLTDVQMGTDLLFWYHYTQQFKQVIWRDQYIPALKYRSTTPPTSGRKTKKAQPVTATFEIYPGWEIVSERYEALVQSYGEMMPPFCTAGFVTRPKQPVLYDAPTLLRHFSECFLTNLLLHTPRSAALDKTIDDTLLHDCLHKEDLDAFWDDEVGLKHYYQ